MVKASGKRLSAKILFFSTFTGLLVAALTFDFLWASSFSPLRHLSLASNWSVDTTVNRIKPAIKDKIGTVKGKKTPILNELNASFADLPGPQLQWEEMLEAPVPRLDGASIQIKNLLYVFAGYGDIDHVHSHVDIYNFTDNTWCGRLDMPKEMANSHLGMATDGRYIYVVAGQYGPQCRAPTARCFVLDTKTKEWKDLPTLPAPRYAPATQLWRGRLHVMGGSKEDRYEPGVEHWSVAVKNGLALEKEWRSEIPIPRGGPHRSLLSQLQNIF